MVAIIGIVLFKIIIKSRSSRVISLVMLRGKAEKTEDKDRFYSLASTDKYARKWFPVA